MSEHSSPPFWSEHCSTHHSSTNLSGIYHDNNGRPWFRTPDGTWIGNSGFQPPQTALLQGNSGLPTQSSVQDPFHFAPVLGTSTGPSIAHTYPVIDPRLIPLPYGADRKFSKPAAIASAKGPVTGPKVAGSCQKAKGRSTVIPPISMTTTLLDLTEIKLPVSAKGWKAITKDHNQWACESGCPVRELKSLEGKYNQLLKSKKPIRDPDCPLEVKRAHHNELKINNGIDTRELSNMDFGDDAGSDNSIEVLDQSTICTAVARRAPTPPPRCTRMNAPELVNKLSQAFDPKALKS
ncbi:hypothetical protein B0H19DRAFT_1267904 [Mycena capillaripes]|nr:hypothetical protein B0H19DRAFT_1267904 [Mycena capillaripes]